MNYDMQQEVALRRAAKEFKWVPCTEWGRMEQARREAEKQAAKRARVLGIGKPTKEVRKPAVKAPRVRKPRAPKPKTVPTRFCSDCMAPLSVQNRIGLCKDCGTINRRRELELGPRPLCNREGCDAVLHRTNSYGLCRRHAASARTMAYVARKKAAAALEAA